MRRTTRGKLRFDDTKYHPFWRECLENHEGTIKQIALEAGYPSYRSLWQVLTKDLSNLRVAEIIKIARTVDNLPAERFYFLLHKHFYGLPDARPIRGYDW